MTTLTLNPVMKARGLSCPPVARHFIEGNKFFWFRPDPTMEVIPVFKGGREEFVNFYSTRTAGQIAAIYDDAYRIAEDINTAFDGLGGFIDAIQVLINRGFFTLVEDN